MLFLRICSFCFSEAVSREIVCAGNERVGAAAEG